MRRGVLAVVAVAVVGCGGGKTPASAPAEPSPAPAVHEGSPPHAGLDAGPPPIRRRVGTYSIHIEIHNKVYFPPGSNQLEPGTPAVLDAVAHALHEHPELLVVEIRGHTDSTEANPTSLSKERAKQVQAYLVGQGIAPTRMPTVGYGDKYPVDTNRTAAGRANNRRVGFKVVKRAR